MTTPAPAVPALDAALATLINKTFGAVDTSVTFLSAQLPDVIHQLLMWHAVKSAMWFGLWLTVFVVLAIVARSLWVKHKAEPGEGYDIATISVGFFAAVVTPAVFINITWLQILIAPKVYLIEYAAQLVKN